MRTICLNLRPQTYPRHQGSSFSTVMSVADNKSPLIKCNGGLSKIDTLDRNGDSLLKLHLLRKRYHCLRIKLEIITHLKRYN